MAYCSLSPISCSWNFIALWTPAFSSDENMECSQNSLSGPRDQETYLILSCSRTWKIPPWIIGSPSSPSSCSSSIFNRSSGASAHKEADMFKPFYFQTSIISILAFCARSWDVPSFLFGLTDRRTSLKVFITPHLMLLSSADLKIFDALAERKTSHRSHTSKNVNLALFCKIFRAWFSRAVVVGEINQTAI